jgi:hypothetical protein
MTRLERQHLMRKLEKNFDAQLRLLAELAAGYYDRDGAVPPEVGGAIGAVEHRRRAYARIKHIFLDARSGPGVKTVIRRFLAEIDKDAATVKKLLALTTSQQREGADEMC